MQISIENLSKQYEKGEAFALNNLSLKIEKGEFIAVLGLSGSGKSTLIRLLNQLIKPCSGSIYFEEKNVTNLKGEGLRLYRRNIGMIFQQYNLLLRNSVLTNVLVGKFGYLSPFDIFLKKFPKKDIQQAETMLQKVGLDGYKNRKARTLSGGQQQRVAVARALMQNPKVILGDEPVSSLDPVTSVEIMKLLQKINEEEGITMLINLHSVELAKKFASRVIGINKGRIIFDSSPCKLDEDAIKAIYAP